MRIRIKGRRKSFSLWLPLSATCLKILVKFASDKEDKENKENKENLSPEAVAELVKALKKFRRQNGSFQLVKVETSEGMGFELQI